MGTNNQVSLVEKGKGEEEMDKRYDIFFKGNDGCHKKEKRVQKVSPDKHECACGG